ncbi:MAG: mechanosensitive ion channel family protein [Pseudomonadota bacterium]
MAHGGSEGRESGRAAWRVALPTAARSLVRALALPALALPVLALLALLAQGSAPAVAQPAAGGPAPMPPAMSDAIEKARESGSVIIVSPQGDGSWDYRALAGPTTSESYDALADGTQPEMRVLDRTQLSVAAFYERLGDRLETAPTVLPRIQSALAEASPDGDPVYFAWVFLVVLGGLCVGWLVEKFYYGVRLVGPWFIAQQQEHPQGFVDKLPILALRVALSVGGVALSCTVALLLGLIFYEPHVPTQKTALIILAAYAAIRVVNAIWRMVLSPYLPNYRIPALDDPSARTLHAWMVSSSAFAFSALAIGYWLEAIGLSADDGAMIQTVGGLLTVLFNLALIRANRVAVGQAILGGREGRRASVPARIGAALWAPALSLYLIIAWAEMAYRVVMGWPVGAPLIIGTYVIMTALIATYGGIAYLIEWIFTRRAPRPAEVAALEHEEAQEDASADRAARPGDAGPEDPGMAAMFGPTSYRMRTMQDLARRVASIFAILAGVVATLWIWESNLFAEENTTLRWTIDIATILFIGYIVYHSVRIGIDQRIEEEGGADFVVEPGGEGGEGAAASRLATLLPLFRNFLLVTIAVITLMMLMLELGVNVTPLFAGAGVVGLAIGFGAQTLVRDIFSGAFFLIDDAFRKGEYIDIGEVKGTVEKISVRSFQLRHHLGYLHTIPFGEVKHLTNYSRDWVMMKLPLRLTYDTDVEKVRKLIKKLGLELLQDPEIGHQFTQPLKSQGVYMMEDSAMIFRVKFMCKPGDQWVIRKKVYAAIRELFEREGVRFAHREVTVRLADGPPNRELTEEERRTIAGSVRPLLDPPDVPGPGGAPAMATDDR